MAKSGSTLPIMFLTNLARDWKRGPPTESRRLARGILKAMRLQKKEDMREMAMLTPAQKKLLRRFAKGNSDGQIVRELSDKESVIADQRAKMKVTLQVHSQARAIQVMVVATIDQVGGMRGGGFHGGGPPDALISTDYI